MRRRPGRRGYTLIEVMMAVACMTIGAVGLLGLQAASTRANMDARQMTIATETTRLWIERLRRDGLGWTIRQQPIAGTQYFTNVDGGWFTPVPLDVRESYGFDYTGRDTRVAANMTYCTHVQMMWVEPGDMVRAEVRTFWHRRGQGTDADSDLRLFPNCASGAEVGVTNELAVVPSKLRSVYAPLTMRWTAVVP